MSWRQTEGQKFSSAAAQPETELNHLLLLPNNIHTGRDVYLLIHFHVLIFNAQVMYLCNMSAALVNKNCIYITVKGYTVLFFVRSIHLKSVFNFFYYCKFLPAYDSPPSFQTSDSASTIIYCPKLWYVCIMAKVQLFITVAGRQG